MTVKLLAAGADPNAPLMSGETPLMEAARAGNLETVRALLAGRPNPNAQEANGGQTALMWAVPNVSPRSSRNWCAHGADVQRRFEERASRR